MKLKTVMIMLMTMMMSLDDRVVWLRREVDWSYGSKVVYACTDASTADAVGDVSNNAVAD